MKYAYTILYVPDVAATCAFYTQAFGFQQKFMTPEKDYAELLSGETTIAFATLTLGEQQVPGGMQASSLGAKPAAVEMAFTTEDIQADFSRAKAAGAIEVSPLTEKPWGQTVGYVRDLNGFLIEICTPIPTP